MSHYIDIHLEDTSVDSVSLHVGVNNLLNDNRQSDIHKRIEKSKRVGVRNIFVSGFVYTTRVSLPILEKVHNLITAVKMFAFILITEISEGFVYIKMVFIY